MTLAEMKTYLELLLAETSSSSDFLSATQQTDVINAGCEMFALETKIIRPSPNTISLVADQASYDLPSTFIAVAEGVFMFSSSGNVYEYEILPIEGGYKTIIMNDSDSDLPTHYAIRGYTKALSASSGVQTIILDPPPSTTRSTYRVKVYYAKQALSLTNTTDVSDIPVHFHRGPVVAAAAITKERDQEFDQAQFFWGDPVKPRIGSYWYWVKLAKREMSNWSNTPSGWRFSEGNYVKR